MMTRKDIFYSLSLVILGILAVLPGINGSALLGQGDEYMHIATVRESLDAESYFLPILNGAANYHKPPLLFWLGMISEAIFGRSLWAARLPAVLMAIGSVLLVYWTLRTLRTPRLTSFLAAALYLFSLGVLKFGRLLMMEQALVFSMLGVAFFFVRYVRSGRMTDVLLAGLVSAVAYLYKGPLFQVYSGLMLAAWAVAWLWRFDLSPFRWRGRSAFARVVKVGVVFHLPLVVPLAWIAVVYFTSPAGEHLFEYFFRFENVNKFLEANQPEGRIFGGWLMYTVPWTILIAGMAWAAFRKKVRTPVHLAAWVLLWSAVLFTLLHLLPNRKDGYYILPAWPLAMIGMARLVSLRGAFFRGLAFWNTVVLLPVAIILVIPGFLLGAGPAYFILTFAAVLIPALLLIRWQSSSDRTRNAGMVLSGVLILCAFQYAILPLVDRPDAPENIRARLSTELCVVSRETWDGFVYKNILPGYDIQHSIPGTPGGCAESGRAIIAYRVDDFTPPAGYREVAAWPVWREGLNADEILNGLKNPIELQTNIVYYEFESSLGLAAEARP